MPKKHSDSADQFVTGRLTSNMKSAKKVGPHPKMHWKGCDTFFTIECNPTHSARCPYRVEDAPPWLLEKIGKYGMPPWWRSGESKRKPRRK